MSRGWRRLAVRLHIWTGLLVGPLGVVLGVSGAALVFRPELEALLAGPPALAPAGSTPSLDAVVRVALLSHPGGEAHRLKIADDASRPYRVEVVRGAQRLDVDVAPASLRVVGSRAPERSVLVAVHALHVALHAGRVGAVVVGLLGIWLVVEAVSGAWLYGAAITRPRSLLRGASSRAVHRIVGALSLAAGVLLGLTGTLLALRAVVTASDGAGAPPPAALTRLDSIALRVEATVPGARILALTGEPEHIRVDVRRPSGETGALRVARGSGEITAAGTPAATGWGLVRRLHAGDFAGWLSRSLYAAVGLALAVLAMTGFVIAARRQSSKVLT